MGSGSRETNQGVAADMLILPLVAGWRSVQAREISLAVQTTPCFPCLPEVGVHYATRPSHVQLEVLEERSSDGRKRSERAKTFNVRFHYTTTTESLFPFSQVDLCARGLFRKRRRYSSGLGSARRHGLCIERKIEKKLSNRGTAGGAKYTRLAVAQKSLPSLTTTTFWYCCYHHNQYHYYLLLLLLSAPPPPPLLLLLMMMMVMVMVVLYSTTAASKYNYYHLQVLILLVPLLLLLLLLLLLVFYSATAASKCNYYHLQVLFLLVPLLLLPLVVVVVVMAVVFYSATAASKYSYYHYKYFCLCCLCRCCFCC